MLPAHHSFAKKRERNVTVSHTCSPPRGKKKPLLAKKFHVTTTPKKRRSQLPISPTLFPPTCAKLFSTFHVAYGSFPTFFSLSENEQAGSLSSLFQVYTTANAGSVQFCARRKSHCQKISKQDISLLFSKSLLQPVPVKCNFVQGEKAISFSARDIARVFLFSRLVIKHHIKKELPHHREKFTHVFWS